LEGIKTADVPAVTDANSNGTLDANEVNNAKEEVAKALKAAQAAQEKKDELERNGVVNPSDVEALENLNKEVTKAKEDANQAVEALPEGATSGEDTKDSLQKALEGIKTADVPAVTDANSNGTLDAIEVNNAKEKVAKALKAAQAAQEKKDELERNGVVN
ncbi:GA-like domain-containing protein, partial [Streptococcus pyogenes]|uniref:GA-like domain-containing protein n=1 Tax=Streptococcus pyogenes TaxID=1314 RepID=UPI00387DC8F7